MRHAYVFPGQGAQSVGMGKDLYENLPEAKALFEQANEILGFRITDIMFSGTDEELKQTKVTQPAVFLHSVILAKALGVKPDAVAGHSLGEFSALVVSGALSFEDGLKLVSKRAMAMQQACEKEPGTMAAVLGLEDSVIEQICAETEGVVVAANYNCPGQLVISGAVEAVDAACVKLKEAGARRALRLPVGGAFHSPLMEPAREELARAIAEAPFHTPSCPIYRGLSAKLTGGCDGISLYRTIDKIAFRNNPPCQGDERTFIPKEVFHAYSHPQRPQFEPAGPARTGHLRNADLCPSGLHDRR